MTTDAVVQQRTLILVGLWGSQQGVCTVKRVRTYSRQNASDKLASGGRQGEIDDHSPSSATKNDELE